MEKLKFTGERLTTEVYGKIVIEHLHRYSFALSYVNGKNVLDIACGEGYGSNLLSRLAKNVAGVDIAPDVISHANNKYSKSNLNFYVGSVLQIPFPDNHFDVIVSYETIEHISEHEKMLCEFKRVLKPSGLMIISSPEKGKYSDNNFGKNSKFHVKELYFNDFKELIKSQFTSSQVFYQDFFQGTIIIPNHSIPSKIEFWKGDFLSTNKFFAISPVFVIIVASNSLELIENLELSTSIFSNNLFFENEIKEEVQRKLNKILKGFRYRLINFIFFPFDLFNKFLKN